MHLPKLVRGLIVRDCSVRYTGEYASHLRDGQGTFWYPDGSVYEGTWAKGERNGYGEYTYPNGDKYKGWWQDNRRHGHGEYIYKELKIRYKGGCQLCL